MSSGEAGKQPWPEYWPEAAFDKGLEGSDELKKKLHLQAGRKRNEGQECKDLRLKEPSCAPHGRVQSQDRLWQGCHPGSRCPPTPKVMMLGTAAEFPKGRCQAEVRSSAVSRGGAAGVAVGTWNGVTCRPQSHFELNSKRKKSPG